MQIRAMITNVTIIKEPETFFRFEKTIDIWYIGNIAKNDNTTARLVDIIAKNAKITKTKNTKALFFDSNNHGSKKNNT